MASRAAAQLLFSCSRPRSHNGGADPHEGGGLASRSGEIRALEQRASADEPVLYGDEVGMWGGARGFKPMIFADALRDGGKPRLDDDGQPVRIEADVLAHFKTLIRLRKEHPALRTGAVPGA